MFSSDQLKTLNKSMHNPMNFKEFILGPYSQIYTTIRTKCLNKKLKSLTKLENKVRIQYFNEKRKLK